MQNVWAIDVFIMACSLSPHPSLPPSLFFAAVARLMSEEVLDSESDQISETGSHSGNKKKPSTPG